LLKADDAETLGVVLNARLSSVLIRALTAQMYLRESYVARLPLPERDCKEWASFESACITLKTDLATRDLLERNFTVLPTPNSSLTESWRRFTNEAEGVAAALHAIEGISERDVFQAYGVVGDDLQAAFDETGTPTGWFPLIAGYDDLPQLHSGLPVPPELFEGLSRVERRTLSADDLADLKQCLRSAYEVDTGGKLDEEDDGVDDGNREDEDDSEAAESGSKIQIPAETLVEELSQKVEIHPISVCRMLRQLREKEGVVSNPKLIRFVEDYVTVLVLRLLGHQWPREVEERELLAAWVDKDGIIPITQETSEPALITRVQARLASDFGDERAGAVEREFQEITGRPLAAWLASDFFKRHISQFRKRPIAWQLTSLGMNNTKRRGRGAAQGAPAFSCLIYYHRLNADLLPKLRTHYIGPLRLSLQTELGGLEKMRERSADQDARRLELEGKLEELKAFDARLDEVLGKGFGSPTLEKIAAKELLDKWTAADAHARPPQTREALISQERGYHPDLNDGVRVNIAPLQRAGLLAADVLAAKHVEKAISDRAEWRADERRWCREGKLQQPGWWTVDMPRMMGDAA
jgi:hypothetical protein